MFSDKLFLEFFAAMFAIMNPFTNLPIFLSLTTGALANKRVKIASMMACALVVLLGLVVFCGPKLLGALGVSVPSFEIAGGIIVFLIALSMLHAKHSTIHHATSKEQEEQSTKSNPAIVPLTMPLIGGPGAITTIIIYTNKLKHDVTNYTTILSVLGLMILLVWIVFCFGSPIARLLRTTGMNIITRFMAIILASIGVGMMGNGVKAMFNLG